MSKLRRLTVLLDAELFAAVQSERTKIMRETGLNVGMSQVAARAMRSGLAAKR